MWFCLSGLLLCCLNGEALRHGHNCSIGTFSAQREILIQDMYINDYVGSIKAFEKKTANKANSSHALLLYSERMRINLNIN